jgi:hypothetical protein
MTTTSWSVQIDNSGFVPPPPRNAGDPQTITCSSGGLVTFTLNGPGPLQVRPLRATEVSLAPAADLPALKPYDCPGIAVNGGGSYSLRLSGS